MIGDGENVNHVIKVGSMDDIGNRLSHLSELYELWQAGLDILYRYDRNTPGYEDKKKELEIASRLLAYHMEKDYHEENYKKVIDLLPWNGEDIKDENQN